MTSMFYGIFAAAQSSRMYSLIQIMQNKYLYLVIIVISTRASTKTF